MKSSIAIPSKSSSASPSKSIRPFKAATTEPSQKTSTGAAKQVSSTKSSIPAVLKVFPPVRSEKSAPPKSTPLAQPTTTAVPSLVSTTPTKPSSAPPSNSALPALVKHATPQSSKPTLPKKLVSTDPSKSFPSVHSKSSQPVPSTPAHLTPSNATSSTKPTQITPSKPFTDKASNSVAPTKSATAAPSKPPSPMPYKQATAAPLDNDSHIRPASPVSSTPVTTNALSKAPPSLFKSSSAAPAAPSKSTPAVPSKSSTDEPSKLSPVMPLKYMFSTRAGPGALIIPSNPAPASLFKTASPTKQSPITTPLKPLRPVPKSISPPKAVPEAISESTPQAPSYSSPVVPLKSVSHSKPVRAEPSKPALTELPKSAIETSKPAPAALSELTSSTKAASAALSELKSSTKAASAEPSRSASLIVSSTAVPFNTASPVHLGSSSTRSGESSEPGPAKPSKPIPVGLPKPGAEPSKPAPIELSKLTSSKSAFPTKTSPTVPPNSTSTLNLELSNKVGNVSDHAKSSLKQKNTSHIPVHKFKINPVPSTSAVSSTLNVFKSFTANPPHDNGSVATPANIQTPQFNSATALQGTSSGIPASTPQSRSMPMAIPPPIASPQHTDLARPIIVPGGLGPGYSQSNGPHGSQIPQPQAQPVHLQQPMPWQVPIQQGTVPYPQSQQPQFQQHPTQQGQIPPQFSHPNTARPQPTSIPSPWTPHSQVFPPQHAPPNARNNTLNNNMLPNTQIHSPAAPYAHAHLKLANLQRIQLQDSHQSPVGPSPGNLYQNGKNTSMPQGAPSNENLQASTKNSPPLSNKTPAPSSSKKQLPLRTQQDIALGKYLYITKQSGRPRVPPRILAAVNALKPVPTVAIPEKLVPAHRKTTEAARFVLKMPIHDPIISQIVMFQRQFAPLFKGTFFLGPAEVEMEMQMQPDMGDRLQEILLRMLRLTFNQLPKTDDWQTSINYPLSKLYTNYLTLAERKTWPTKYKMSKGFKEISTQGRIDMVKLIFAYTMQKSRSVRKSSARARKRLVGQNISETDYLARFNCIPNIQLSAMEAGPVIQLAESKNPVVFFEAPAKRSYTKPTANSELIISDDDAEVNAQESGADSDFTPSGSASKETDRKHVDSEESEVTEEESESDNEVIDPDSDLVDQLGSGTQPIITGMGLLWLIQNNHPGGSFRLFYEDNYLTLNPTWTNWEIDDEPLRMLLNMDAKGVDGHNGAAILVLQTKINKLIANFKRNEPLKVKLDEEEEKQRIEFKAARESSEQARQEEQERIYEEALLAKRKEKEEAKRRMTSNLETARGSRLRTPKQANYSELAGPLAEIEPLPLRKGSDDESTDPDFETSPKKTNTSFNKLNSRRSIAQRVRDAPTIPRRGRPRKPATGTQPATKKTRTRNESLGSGAAEMRRRRISGRLRNTSPQRQNKFNPDDPIVISDESSEDESGAESSLEDEEGEDETPTTRQTQESRSNEDDLSDDDLILKSSQSFRSSLPESSQRRLEAEIDNEVNALVRAVQSPHRHRETSSVVEHNESDEEDEVFDIQMEQALVPNRGRVQPIVLDSDEDNAPIALSSRWRDKRRLSTHTNIIDSSEEGPSEKGNSAISEDESAVKSNEMLTPEPAEEFYDAVEGDSGVLHETPSAMIDQENTKKQSDQEASTSGSPVIVSSPSASRSGSSVAEEEKEEEEVSSASEPGSRDVRATSESSADILDATSSEESSVNKKDTVSNETHVATPSTPQQILAKRKLSNVAKDSDNPPFKRLHALVDGNFRKTLDTSNNLDKDISKGTFTEKSIEKASLPQAGKLPSVFAGSASHASGIHKTADVTASESQSGGRSGDRTGNPIPVVDKANKSLSVQATPQTPLNKADKPRPAFSVPSFKYALRGRYAGHGASGRRATLTSISSGPGAAVLQPFRSPLLSRQSEAKSAKQDGNLDKFLQLKKGTPTIVKESTPSKSDQVTPNKSVATTKADELVISSSAESSDESSGESSSDGSSDQSLVATALTSNSSPQIKNGKVMSTRSVATKARVRQAEVSLDEILESSSESSLETPLKKSVPQTAQRLPKPKDDITETPKGSNNDGNLQTNDSDDATSSSEESESDDLIFAKRKHSESSNNRTVKRLRTDNGVGQGLQTYGRVKHATRRITVQDANNSRAAAEFTSRPFTTKDTTEDEVEVILLDDESDEDNGGLVNSGSNTTTTPRPRRRLRRLTGAAATRAQRLPSPVRTVRVPRSAFEKRGSKRASSGVPARGKDAEEDQEEAVEISSSGSSSEDVTSGDEDEGVEESE